MVDPRVVAGLNGLANLCERSELSEVACMLYAKAVKLPNDELLQAIVDWTRCSNAFPQPADLIDFRKRIPAAPSEA